MNDKFESAAKEYIEKVNSVCFKLVEGLNLRTKAELWEYRKTHHEMELVINGIKYMFHGRGCRAFNEEFFLDWDFGYGNRWCGIEPWLLARTLKENKSSYFEYFDGSKIKEECEQAVLNCEMIKKYDLYYFATPTTETFEPDFPKEFDTLVVEHFNSQWEIKKNKMVDRFLRKSNRVSQQIGKSPDKYTLRFILDGKEIYTIPYDDVEYPEKAIDIMFELLKDNKKESK